jgi:tetratricopeptide (TPR) repeat protein
MEIQRILDKYDRLMDEKEFEEAGRHLNYWVAEAEAVKDDRSAFTLLNELVGFYRMQGRKEETLSVIDRLLKVTEQMDLNDTVSGATAYINAATGYKSADMAAEALPLYEKALVIYTRDLSPADTGISALYNNMALTLMELKDYDRSREFLVKALEILSKNENSENEQAITLLNLADLAEKTMHQEEAEEKIAEYVEKAKEKLDESFLKKNAGFKFTAEKCIPAIKYHGYFLVAMDLEEKAAALSGKKI